ncbi:MAG: septum formation initiator family protein [Ottowia sp.]|uniref:FtsB family cell division protein n=1 Tax=Ottowia sp. TaxID=1898956 RepID=UPI001D31A41E|nr:septum formation initiator family protein [Ottowia sp.]MCB2069773.1 septum formation initiator family protein [Ottowia sp.]MCP5258052.1 septum formation initiator family protein [Burkholderiaceae bacterium]HPR44562.1 septum formation initiator family protein [Ottowia sp.]HRW73639.1 septum formation initiator family protein [Ottowia sp.]
MSQRFIPAVLLLILVVLHGQLWFGRGSVPNVAVLQRKLDEQKAANVRTQQAIDQLQNEVTDLKTGLATVEEKARTDLGMVKQGEIFVQVSPK